MLVILIDGCRFGASSAFGGPIPTLDAERLAENGLTFNRFHATALCSPTRQALLPGKTIRTTRSRLTSASGSRWRGNEPSVRFFCAL